MSRRTAFSLLLLAIGFALGALREFLFVNVNYQLDHLLRGTPYSFAHSAFQRWAHDWETSSLETLKWSLTAAFMLANLLLTVAMCRLRFGPGGPVRVVVGLFVAVALLSVSLFLFADAAPWIYPVALQLAHALQYPVPMLILWVLSLGAPAAQRDRYI